MCLRSAPRNTPRKLEGRAPEGERAWASRARIRHESRMTEMP